MKRSLSKGVLGLCLGAAMVGQPARAADDITGAGSSAAAPAYRIWGQEYRKAGGEALEYDPVGSGAGMARIKQRQAEFGASDVIAPKAALAKDGLVMFPTVVSGIVPVVNLRKGGAPLKLSGEVLARIFLGEISHWQAPEIVALNPGVALPNEAIRVVCRSDGSGSTHHFSDYLSKVSPAWKARFGVASKHPWPEGFIAVKGSGEVSKTVRSTPGAIGYIDYSYVVEDHLTPVQLKTASGISALRPRASAARWWAPAGSPTGISRGLIQMPGSAWPITMAPGAAAVRRHGVTARARFFVWAYGRGDALAAKRSSCRCPKVQASAFRSFRAWWGRTASRSA
jgi:phosphate transport system substrate-binding protein